MGTRNPEYHLLAGLIIMISISFVIFSESVQPVSAANPTSWNPLVQCTPLVVRISDITANETGSASYSASKFTPGTTTAVSGGNAKRWLTPGHTPPGWVSPGPPCTVTNSKGTTSLFVEIDGIERGSVTTEDSSSNYDATNGRTSHATTYDSTFNIFDPKIVSNYDSSCSSPTDPTCYGRIHVEIDHDWIAATYCGTNTQCDPAALAAQTSRTSTKIDVQGFVYWDPANLNSQYHSYNGWELHALTGWRLSGQLDFSISASPSSLSFNAGSPGSFTVTVTGQNGFTSTVNLSASVSPSAGLSVSCNPTSVSGSGSSNCTLNSSTAGNYAVTVTGTSGSITHSTTVSVTVTQQTPPDFSISANPTFLSITQGSSGTSTITLTSFNTFSGTVNLSSAVSPVGPTSSLSPTSVTLSSGNSATSILTVSITSTTPPGSYTVIVAGTSSSLSHTVSVSVTVTSAAPTGDFTMSASPSSLTMPHGTSGNSTITMQSIDGFTGSITLSASIDPSAKHPIALSFSSSTIQLPPGGSGSVLLTIRTRVKTPPGTYTISVTGSSGSLSHSIVITVQVT